MIIAIIIVYLASIVVVNFFGLKIKNFEGLVYVQDIECDVVVKRETETDVTKYDNVANDDRVWYRMTFQPGDYTEEEENLAENPNVALIDYRVYPDNADNKRVKFLYDKEAAKGLCLVDEDKSTILFLRKGGITITLESADGGGIHERIFVFAN